jgi:hypothetical protein
MNADSSEQHARTSQSQLPVSPRNMPPTAGEARFRYTLRPAEPKNSGSRSARFMTSTWDRMNGRSAWGVHAPKATMPTRVCTCSMSVTRPDRDMQVIVTRRRFTGVMLNHARVETTLVAPGRKTLTRRHMNNITSNKDATGWYFPAQFSGESTRPNSTVTSSHSRMSWTVAAAIMNLPRSESILPTCK